MDTFNHAFIIAGLGGWVSLKGFHGFAQSHERGKARQNAKE